MLFMMTYKIVFAATLLTTALIAGLFYAYSVSVNPGLNRLSDSAYLQSMQHINRVILNPLFMASFMGALIMLPICTFIVFRHDGISPSFWFILAATLLYVIGTFGVTIAGNVPLNVMLDQFNIEGAGAQELRAFRAQFEMPWNNLHRVRTIANVLSLICAIVAALWK
jgi:uncharacterized membrane protein